MKERKLETQVKNKKHAFANKMNKPNFLSLLLGKIQSNHQCCCKFNDLNVSNVVVTVTYVYKQSNRSYFYYIVNKLA